MSASSMMLVSIPHVHDNMCRAHHGGKIRTSDLPLGTVLRPQTNTVLLFGEANGLVEGDNAGAKVLPPLSNLLVGDPDILGLIALGCRVPRTPSQALLVGHLLDRSLEKIVDGLVSRVEGLEERAVDELPVTVDGGTVGALGAGNGQGVGSARRGRLGDGLDIRRGILFGRHGL